MLWPVVLPFQITCVLAICAIAILTFFAPRLKWKRSRTFSNALAASLILFIPSCIGIMSIVDAQRFGLFHYRDYSQVKDFRIERYLPPAATDIDLQKYPQGHRARYHITESALRDYVDGLWRHYDTYAPGPHQQRSEPELIHKLYEEQWAIDFRGLDWPMPASAIEFHSPSEDDSGGATYFYDPATQTAFHRAGYW